MTILVGAVALIGGLIVGRFAHARRAPAGPRSSATTGSGSVTRSRFSTVPRRRLPTFADVGGFAQLKDEIRGTLGLLLEHPDRAEEYRITWGGLLLHGPPGCGKSFFARAIAGEFGCDLVAVNTSDLISQDAGAGPGRVEAAFEYASQRLPCVLLFDEFDALAGDRSRNQEVGGSREVLTQLLQSVEQWRREPRLLVVATTNDVEALDPAAVRAGRFDRHVRLDLPDSAGRRAVFEATLRGRPHDADIDLDALDGALLVI